MNNSMHTNWSEKYRPTRIEDVVLSSSVKRRLMAIRDQNVSVNLALFGAPGTGKTTTAKLLNKDGTLFFNCATEGSMEMIRRIDRTCSSFNLSGGKRVVLLDEADTLKMDVQSALKATIERLGATTMFVLTTNHVLKLAPELLSRFTKLKFTVEKGDVDIFNQFHSRVIDILECEGIEYDRSRVMNILREDFPDMRQALVNLQYEFGLESEPVH